MLDGSEHESFGTYLEVDRPHRLAMTWQWLEQDDPASRVEIDLRPVPDGTELTFTHAQLADEATRCTHLAGWTGSLDRLQRLCFEHQGEQP